MIGEKLQNDSFCRQTLYLSQITGLSLYSIKYVCTLKYIYFIFISGPEILELNNRAILCLPPVFPQ